MNYYLQMNTKKKCFLTDIEVLSKSFLFIFNDEINTIYTSYF